MSKATTLHIGVGDGASGGAALAGDGGPSEGFTGTDVADNDVRGLQFAGQLAGDGLLDALSGTSKTTPTSPSMTR